MTEPEEEEAVDYCMDCGAEIEGHHACQAPYLYDDEETE